MFLKSITSVFALFPSAFGLPQHIQAANTLHTANNLAQSPQVQWDVALFYNDCSPGGCTSVLQISAPANYLAGSLAFNVSCVQASNNWHRDWVECSPLEGHDHLGVVRYINQQTDSPPEEFGYFHLFVSHQYSGMGLNFNITGYSRVGAYDDWHQFKEMPVIKRELI